MTLTLKAPEAIPGAFFLGVPSMGAPMRVQVPPRAGHSERSDAQLHEGTRVIS
jgi:hypothetical protein